MEVNPLSIILVKSDSKGDRLLFRYPFHIQENSEPSSTKRKNPYTLPSVEDLLQSPPQPTSNISKGHLTGFTDEVLSSLFAVKPELCNRKFELKVNDVRFVSHPTLVPLHNKQQDDTGGLLINIVFALQALASHSVVRCYHDLSKRMGIALKHEEQRCGYISEQTQVMMTAHDDGYTSNPEATFRNILEKCTLANNIKKMYDDLCVSGLVSTRINRWIPLSFCLPQKVHQWHMRGKIIEPEDIDRCLQALRPYHSLLLLYPVQQLNDFTTLDGSPSLFRILSQYSPLKNLQSLAADADITLSHVLELTAHLVYWAKATVIFPICSTNKYVISPDAPICLQSPLVDKFNEVFPDINLIRVISEFSLPTSLGQKCNPLCLPSQQSQLVQMIIWMLQHHLLLQLHTYIQYLPTEHGVTPDISDERRSRISSLPSRSSRVTDVTTNSSRGLESEVFTVSGTPEFKSDSDQSSRTSKSDADFSSSGQVKQDFQEELLLDFSDSERSVIFKVCAFSNIHEKVLYLYVRQTDEIAFQRSWNSVISVSLHTNGILLAKRKYKRLIPAANSTEDLNLFAKLYRKGYFHGEHHVEEIMYLENLRRSQLLQLLDKFRDVLITYETEDPAIAMFSCST